MKHDITEYLDRIMPRTGVTFYKIPGKGLVCGECGYQQLVLGKVEDGFYRILLRETHSKDCSSYIDYKNEIKESTEDNKVRMWWTE